MLRPYAAVLVLAACAGRQASVPPVASAVRADTTAAYWPTRAWREVTPESQGFSATALAQLVRATSADGANIHSLLVVRNGTVVLDVAFYPFAAGLRHDIASNTKSVTSLLVGAAIWKGALSGPNDRLLAAIDERPTRHDDRKEQITIGNLLAMRSGLDCGLHGERELDAMRATRHWVQAALDIPMAGAPDARMAYCSPNYHLVAKAVQRRTGRSLADFAREALFAPLGIRDYRWPADPDGLNDGWGDLQLHPRDLAKLGLLALHDGVWEGRRLLPPGWIARTTAPISRFNDDNFYGMGWWTHPASPPGFFEGIGRGGQRLSIWPEKGIVIVFMGGGFEPSTVGDMLLKSWRADTAIAEDPTGVQALRSAIAAAAAAPASEEVSPIPAAIQQASGKTFTFGPNDFGLRALRFDIESGLVMRLDLADRSLNLPVGLDGRYRFSTDSLEGIAPAARATVTPDGLDIDLNLVGKINRYRMDLRFNGDGIAVSMAELTGTFRATIVGRAQR